MNFKDSPAEAEYRAKCRAFLYAHLEKRGPGDVRCYRRGEDSPGVLEEAKSFQRIKWEAGFAGITWPTEWHGQGGSPVQQMIYDQEEARYKTTVNAIGLQLGSCIPTICRWGTQEQRDRFAPPALRGEEVWCQFYSEPAGGSDLGALRTSAERDADDWIINGQKIWTSFGHKGDWIFVLVRTDFEAAKHDGISLVLVDMAQAGVTTRPIKLLSGASHFCETFFDDARCELDNVVGELNQGWTVAKYLLTHEREMIGGSAIGRAAMRPLSEFVTQQVGLNEQGVLSDPVLRTDVARNEIDALSFLWTTERVADEAKAGQGVGAMSAMLKYYGTELNKRRYELMMYSAGHDALTLDREDHLARDWLRTKGNSIEGGTSEVQLNIVAKRILGLPSV